MDGVVYTYQLSYSGAPPLRSGCARLQQLQQQQALPGLMQLVHLRTALRDGSARSSSVRSDTVMRLTTRLAQRAPPDRLPPHALREVCLGCPARELAGPEEPARGVLRRLRGKYPRDLGGAATFKLGPSRSEGPTTSSRRKSLILRGERAFCSGGDSDRELDGHTTAIPRTWGR